MWRNDREADLVVWGENFTVVIENKVDASEQPTQCDDLYKNFKNEKRASFRVPDPGRSEAANGDHTVLPACFQDALVARGPGDVGGGPEPITVCHRGWQRY